MKKTDQHQLLHCAACPMFIISKEPPYEMSIKGTTLMIDGVCFGAKGQILRHSKSPVCHPRRREVMRQISKEVAA